MHTEGFQHLDANVCRMVVEEVSSAGKSVPVLEEGEEVKVQDMPSGTTLGEKERTTGSAKEGMETRPVKHTASALADQAAKLKTWIKDVTDPASSTSCAEESTSRGQEESAAKKASSPGLMEESSMQSKV